MKANKLSDIVKKGFSKLKTAAYTAALTGLLFIPTFTQKKAQAQEANYDCSVQIEAPTKMMPDNVNKYFPGIRFGVIGESTPLTSYSSTESYRVSPFFIAEYDKSIHNQEKNRTLDWKIAFSGIGSTDKDISGALIPSHQLGFTKRIDFKESSLAIGYSHLLYLNNLLDIQHLGELELALGIMWLMNKGYIGGGAELHVEPDSAWASIYDIRPTVQNANIFAGLTSNTKFPNPKISFNYSGRGNTYTFDLEKNIKNNTINIGVNAKTPGGFESHQGVGAHAGFLNNIFNIIFNYDFSSFDKKSTFALSTEFGIPQYNKDNKKISNIDVKFLGSLNNKEDKTTPLKPFEFKLEDLLRYKQFISNNPNLEDFYDFAAEITDMEEASKGNAVLLHILYSELGAHKFIQYVGKEEFEEKYGTDDWERYSDSVWNVIRDKADHEMAFDPNSPYNTNDPKKTYDFIHKFLADTNDLFNKDLPAYELGCGRRAEFLAEFMKHTSIEGMEILLIAAGVGNMAMHTTPIFLKDGITYIPHTRENGTATHLIRTTNKGEIFKAIEELMGGQMMYCKFYKDGKFVETIRSPKAELLLANQAEPTAITVYKNMDEILK